MASSSSLAKPKVRFSNLIDQGLRHRLFKEIQSLTQLNSEGQVTWTGGEDVDQYVSVLRDAFTFPAEISRHEAASDVWRGIFDARKSGKLTDASALEALQRLTDKRLCEPHRKFSMWSRLSYRRPIPAREERFSYDNVSIRLACALPRYMELPDEVLAELRPILTSDMPHYGYLIAAVTARNATHAADKIFAATEIFQSVYNLALKPWNIFGSEQKPEALLMMGPYHFLFRGRKSLLPETNWYNQNFQEEYWDSGSSDEIFKSAKVVRKALSKLETHPLREPLSGALLMMNDGMEAADMTRRTHRYWTALERLFQADEERASYEKIIARASYLNDPSDLAKAKLRRLMRIRNRYVHMGRRENEHHQLTQYLAAEVRSHLFYLLMNGDDFADHHEFIEMTDLPSDARALQRRRQAIERRERMIEKRRHRPD
jgi:hypothetical protein